MNKMRYGFCLGATALAWAFSGGTTPAGAQSTSAAGSTPASASALDAVITYGQTLKNNGIYFRLGYVENVASLVSGGLQKGTMPIGHVYFGTDLDLQTILGIPGASFHISFDERYGTSINKIAGTQGPLQAHAGPIALRLGEFYWEQGFDNDRLDIIVGRTNPTFDFAFPDVACEFVSSIICNQPGSWYFSNSDQAYPTATWGGRVNFAITPKVYVRAGVYDADPSQGGFRPNGFNWNTAHSVGVFVPVEIGYQTNFNNAQYPAKYDLGAYDDATSYTTPSFTTAGGQALGGRSRQGRTAAWAQFQQTVWRPDRATNQSLTVFGGALVYSGNAPYWGQYYAGILDRAPVASRPRDTIGLIGSLYQNNSASHPNKSTQWIFELNYGVSIVPGVTLKPYTQYVVAPNHFVTTATAATKQPADAWVVGFQVAINFAELLQYPQFIAH